MDSDNFLLTVAVVAVLVSLVGITFTYNSVSNFQNYFTGHAIENGTINLSIEQLTSINITHANATLKKDLNWGSGRVEAGKDEAILVSNGTVQRGTWSALSEGFRIENIGNTHVTNLSVHADKAADTFIGNANAEFQYNLSNYEASSCNDWEAGIEDTYVDFTTGPVEVCNNFTTTASSDVLRMDVRIVIPSASEDGPKTNIVRLTYT